MAVFRNQKGASRLKVFIFFVFLFIVIHAGVKLVPMYMDFERMQDEMKMKASIAQVLKDDEILKDLVQKAKELDLPLSAESFVIVRDTDRRRMSISTEWDVEVDFLWGTYIRTYHFEPSVEESIMSVVR